MIVNPFSSYFFEVKYKRKVGLSLHFAIIGFYLNVVNIKRYIIFVHLNYTI